MPSPSSGTARILGTAAVVFSVLYFLSDVLEVAQGGFSTPQLLITYVAEADLEPWVTLHGLVMLAAGSAFGVAVVRAGVLPRWTGQVLVLGVVLVAAGSFLPAGVQLVCAGARDLAFAGMGLSLLVRGGRSHFWPDGTTDGVSGPCWARTSRMRISP